MPFITIHKQQATNNGSPRKSLNKKVSQIFGVGKNPYPAAGLSRLKRAASRIFEKIIRPHRSDMDGMSSPHHRTAPPTRPALSSHVATVRDALRSSDASWEVPTTYVPQRKRSVRFEGLGVNSQLDGQVSERRSKSESSSHSRLEALTTKLAITSATDTVVRRANSKTKPNVPFLDTHVDFLHDQVALDRHSSPSTMSSSTPLRDPRSMWSPASTASTGATSFTSPGSSGSKNKRQTPEDCQNTSKTVANPGEENQLPPIEEDSARFIMLPVQETTLTVAPSVTTVENAAAAKCALETFHAQLMEASSPRSIRRKKFEQEMCDVGMPHEDRIAAREKWFKAESDHLRQMRVLKASSIARHNAKGISIAGYDTLRVLGKGSFGVVRLVTESGPRSADELDKNITPKSVLAGKPLSDVYAMKVIRKSEMLRACQEGHLRAERDFLVASEGSRWVVPLLSSFQDNSNLYLVMEYMIGGDFLGLLLREDVLDEEVAR
ncbi:hypothetical protein AC579_4194 [Lecanosticta acicola]|uniref:non-specific serine/threonine protein kinase n=1 Tax=Lecanosticta acicola TaxID=111012 RepID=A0AAI9E8N8_9PEZI|nr:hypothetical protein AC579_4194 [Lecanosticta acicola]